MSQLPIPSFATRSYIVVLKDGIDLDSHLKILPSKSDKLRLTHQWSPNLLNGFAVTLDIDHMSLIEHENVKYIAENHPVIGMAVKTQNDASWGIARLSSDKKLDSSAKSFKYQYDDGAGAGTDVYVLDTGIQKDHVDFDDRVRVSPVFADDEDEGDENGHGTHLAGVVAGEKSGVAKKANLIDVKVLDSNAVGTVANVISALQWVQKDAAAVNTQAGSATPAVILMSFCTPAGYDASQPLKDVIPKIIAGTDATTDGTTNIPPIHVIAAAGNGGSDAGDVCPACIPGVVAVGSTTIQDSRADVKTQSESKVTISNVGKTISLFAPGVDIKSAWIGTSKTEYALMSGTSVAAAHVAGLSAYFLKLLGNMTPDKLRSNLVSYSEKRSLSDIPDNTVNRLAHNDAGRVTGA